MIRSSSQECRVVRQSQALSERPASVLSGPSCCDFHLARREAAGPVDARGTAVVTEPRIELMPARHAVCSDASVVLDVLVRITPPQPEVHFPRTPLNLALVLDRSGSMAGMM